MQHFERRAVSAPSYVFFYGKRIDKAAVLKDETHLLFEERMIFEHRNSVPCFTVVELSEHAVLKRCPILEHGIQQFRRYSGHCPLERNARHSRQLHVQQRFGGAVAYTAHFYYVGVYAVGLKILFNGFFRLSGSCRQSACSGAYINYRTFYVLPAQCGGFLRVIFRTERPG